jgi:ADP-dependent NAD(P)H-hydrate dehydratase / NAD(P)H-hydrate epimerase
VPALLTAAEMARADAATIAGGVSGIDLMEAAGAAVAEAARALVPDGPVLVLAGPGNNGGDGLVAARLLAACGRPVTVMLLGDPARLRGDAALARDRWTGAILPAAVPLPEAAVVIDALFGAGLDRPLDGLAAEMVFAANAAAAPVVAVDVPSGLHADSGRPLGACIEAAATVTFFRRKPGHLLYPGRALCGRVHVADIGIPARVLDKIAPQAWENAPDLWSAALRWPAWEAHKYRRGHALVVSGGMARTGAARLAAGAALRAGAGLVTLASPGGALAVNAAHLTAVMLRRCDGAEALAALLGDPRFTSVALGPGLGTGDAERAMVAAAVASPAAAVLDADALTAFADGPETLFEALAARDAPAVLTPHDGEFARLFPDLGPETGPRTDRARAAAARAHAVVVLKGPDTVIAAPDGRLAINANAPPWLATAGSGDVLAGIITGLAAQGVPGWQAACAGVWMHGAAGTEAGPGLTAEDLAPALRPVIARLAASR